MLNKSALNYCKNIRKKIIFSIYYARSGHVGPSLSCVELIYSILNASKLKSRLNHSLLLISDQTLKIFLKT